MRKEKRKKDKLDRNQSTLDHSNIVYNLGVLLSPLVKTRVTALSRLVLRMKAGEQLSRPSPPVRLSLVGKKGKGST